MSEHDTGLIIPENIHELLNSGLVPADDLEGQFTEKFRVEGHPDLLVRLNHGVSPETILLATEATRRLSDFDMHPLPAQVIEHDGNAYVVTKWVDGQNLTDVVAETHDPDLLAEVDRTWTAIGRVIMRGRSGSGIVPADIEVPGQYMYGVMRGDTQHEKKIWMVDIADSYYNLLESPADYNELLVCLANGVIELELASGQTLRHARAQLEHAIDMTAATTDAGKKLVKATRHILLHQEEVWPSELDFDTRF